MKRDRRKTIDIYKKLNLVSDLLFEEELKIVGRSKEEKLELYSLKELFEYVCKNLIIFTNNSNDLYKKRDFRDLMKNTALKFFSHGDKQKIIKKITDQTINIFMRERGVEEKRYGRNKVSCWVGIRSVVPK